MGGRFSTHGVFVTSQQGDEWACRKHVTDARHHVTGWCARGRRTCGVYMILTVDLYTPDVGATLLLAASSMEAPAIRSHLQAVCI